MTKETRKESQADTRNKPNSY